jgi:hypothetical protein
VDSADNRWSGERVEFCEHPPSIAMQAFIQRKKSFVDFQKALPFGNMSGWLEKKGAVNTAFKKRYFVLVGGILK